MCGIAGIVKLNPQEQVDDARLKRMRDVLRHRGPDGEGLWVQGPVGLGHRRLAIVDVAGGHQPMPNEDETIWIVFNGEIYNHSALRPRLLAQGHRYRTQSDTETIVHLYEEAGERCVEKLQGMFAFALWDQPRGRLLLARDRLGIKPLYYALTDEELLFASEIKAILAGLPAKPAFNEEILPDFLATRFVASEETFFRGIRKLLPGRTLTWSRGDGLSIRRYWALPPKAPDPGLGMREWANGLQAGLSRAVESHLMSDVPLGLFLSGGLDSSGLAALMARKVWDPIKTFSVGFAERGANELEFGRLMARAIGAEHHEVVATAGEFWDALPRLIWHEDEPIAFPSSVPLYFVSRLARDHVKVVLTGEGADELFLGYNRYRVTAWNERLAWNYRALLPATLQRGTRHLVHRLPRVGRRYAERTFLALDPDPRELFYENFAVFPARYQRAILNGSMSAAARDPYAESLRCSWAAPNDTLDRMSRADIETYLVELLMKQDQMSMAASVESRVPYLDHELVEHALGIPSRFKLAGWTTKAVLRRALKDIVPPAILRRRKLGFPVPVGGWLRDAWWPVVEEFVRGPRAQGRGLFEVESIRRLTDEHRAGEAEHGDRLWLLVNLEIWQRIFLDGEDASDIAQSVRRACTSSG